MFSFFTGASIVGKLEAHTREAIQIRTTSKIKKGSQHLVVQAGPDFEQFPVKAQLIQGDPAAGLYWVRIVEPTDLLQSLRDKFPDLACAEPTKRGRKRMKRGILINSRDLPGFRGVSSDLSESGMRLLVKQELPIGTRFVFVMELDGVGQVPMKMLGEVKWCQLKPSEGSRRVAESYWLGVHFVDISDDQMAMVKRYLSQSEKIENQGLSGGYG